MKTNIVITMAGLGKRFFDAGYNIPKYEILAGSKSLFTRSIESLRNFLSNDSNIIFATLKTNNSSEFITQECKKIGITNYKIVELNMLTRGQAETAFQTRQFWDLKDPLLIFNIDTEIDSDLIKPSDIPVNADGWIPCFAAQGDHWSFVKISSNGIAIEVAEKIRISEYASVGLYWFKSCKYFAEAFSSSFLNRAPSEGECYVAPLYNPLISEGLKVFISNLPVDSVRVLGTPKELELFIKEKGGGSDKL